MNQQDNQMIFQDAVMSMRKMLIRKTFARSRYEAILGRPPSAPARSFYTMISCLSIAKFLRYDYILVIKIPEL